MCTKMKQRWKRVLVCVMTIAMLATQMTAGVWATEEHDCWDYHETFKYTSNGKGTHKAECPECGKTVVESADCVYVNGKCGVCGWKGNA